MAIIERPGSDTTPAVVTASQSLGAVKRPVETKGWKEWLFTVDHKKIGIMYGVVAMFFFIVGGVEALLIRLQLAAPNGTILSADQYNQMFTMHGTTMVFLFAMPMAAAFANYFLPLQIGARDVAFPRLNALSLWLLIVGGLVLNASWFLGGAADGGWFMYAPNSGPVFSPSNGVDYWILGLQIAGVASLIGSINLIVTVLNMRAPGMSLMKMPVFTWMILVVQFLLVFSLPVITVALVLLMFQRSYGATFFDVSQGADPLLWQHLFWIFGHPEVYVLILPAFGIISVSVAVFSVATMAIAIPTGVKIFNWLLTMWGGKVWYTTAMKFAIGLVMLFTVGGLSGVTHSVAPSDTQQTDTYYIVAHFHYVLFGGMVFGLFSGFYYWWPKVFGKMLNEKLGSWNFWLMVIGMNLTFGPMHILGLQGQPRRMYVWTEARAGEGMFNLAFWNLVASIGSFILAVGVLVFLINVVYTARKGKASPLDPWDARTLEWLTTSPPKAHNFDRIPVVHHLDEFFHRKYEEDTATHTMKKIAEGEDLVRAEEEAAEKDIHLPGPSYWPLVLAIGVGILGMGVVYGVPIMVLGGAIVLFASYGWVLEPSVAEDIDFDPPSTDGSTKEIAPLG